LTLWSLLKFIHTLHNNINHVFFAQLFSPTQDLYLLIIATILTTMLLGRIVTTWIGRKIKFHKQLHKITTTIAHSSTFRNLTSYFHLIHIHIKRSPSTPPQRSYRRLKHQSSPTIYTSSHKILHKCKHITVPHKHVKASIDHSAFFPCTTTYCLPTSQQEPSYLVPPAPPDPAPNYIAMPTDTSATRIISFDSDSFQIGIDTHATACMSPDKSDFIPNTLVPFPPSKGGIRAYGKGPLLRINATGTVRWRIDDDNGMKHVITIPNSIYCSQGTQRLLSPQHWGAEANKTNTLNPDSTRSIQYHDRNVLYFGPKGEYKKTIFNHSKSNVPSFFTAAGTHEYTEYCSAVSTVHSSKYHHLEQATCFPASFLISDDEASTDIAATPISPITPPPLHPDEPRYSPVHTNFTDENIADFSSTPLPPTPSVIEEEEEHIAATTDRGELLRWHYRLGHLSFSKLKLMAVLNIIPRRLALVKAPKCACCIYGKMTRTPWRTKAKNNRPIRKSTAAGQCISVDQMESSCLGFVAQLKGRLTKRRYKYATVFIDHFSRYKYVHLQSSLTSEETLQAKVAFEAHSRSLGIQILNYHADNGRFVDNAWTNDIRSKGQTTSLCGVNAHWQNGIAEKGIRDLRESARTALLHAVEKWPSAIIINLWPYALKHAATVHNHLPTRDGRSPLELFSQVDTAPNLKNFHTFGCPVYALDSRLQARQAVNSWAPRARLGANLGQSPRHARNVSLVLNLNTGLVSPQFHIKHDEFFETISRHERSPASPWRLLTGFHKSAPRPTPSFNLPSEPPAQLPAQSQRENLAPTVPPTETAVIPQELIDPAPPVAPTPAPIPPSPNPIAPHGISSRGRMRRPTRRMQESINQGLNVTSYSSYYDALHEDDYEIQDKMMDPIAFKASTDPDTMYYHEAMAAPDRGQFLEAIIKEVNAHIENEHWELIPIESVPDGTKILDSIWSMKRKRDIKTQQVYKHKARLNIHGGQQEYGVHYTETYSPVVNWFSVRLIMILSLIYGWKTRQIDFVLAYPQAPLPYDNYMKLPHGIKTTEGDGNTHVLKLKKNIYGGRNSGRIWNEYLTDGLTQIGFKQSKVDECVYYRDNVIFLNYVDDGIFACADEKKIDKAIKDLSDPLKAKASFVIEDQGNIADYLGINFEKITETKIKLTQPHLIDQIIKEVQLKPTDRRSTPAAPSKILRRDESAPAFKCPFNYRKVIGKLNYLEKSTRPDIAYAAHQCARFCTDPKESHVQAVIHLVKYLQTTREEGILLDPDKNKSFEVYADADFAGNWFPNTAQDDASTAKSRTGYVIMYGTCPLLWGSKLQTCISLSTTEAEYVALSQALRDTIPIMNLLTELKEYGFHAKDTKPTVHCQAFEDNTGALELSKVHKMRPRTKHINNIYHHFRTHVRLGLINVSHVSTEEQLGDIFTKPLAQNLFVKHRKKLLGF
jgi:hypothetical protein